MPNKKDGIRYVIEKVDGMPNVDLVIKYKNGKKIGQKIINLDKLKVVSNESITPHVNKKQKKTKIVYAQIPQNVQQPIIVEKQAGFGDYLAQGFGFALGFEAADALFDGVDDVFEGDW